MLGPVFLHWDGLYPTYHAFFSHLRSQIDDSINGIEVGGRNLLVGSNEEKALTKAIQQSFPSSHHIPCRRHIEENVKRHLRRKVGANDKQIKAVMSDIFGDNGLLAADDEYEFSLVTFELEEEYCSLYAKFPSVFQKTKFNIAGIRVSSQQEKQIYTYYLEEQLVRKHESHFKTYVRLESPENSGFGRKSLQDRATSVRRC